MSMPSHSPASSFTPSQASSNPTQFPVLPPTLPIHSSSQSPPSSHNPPHHVDQDQAQSSSSPGQQGPSPRERGPQPHACQLCQQRKVRCDRHAPCGGCARLRVPCVFKAPAPPRRRKKHGMGPIAAATAAAAAGGAPAHAGLSGGSDRRPVGGSRTLTGEELREVGERIKGLEERVRKYEEALREVGKGEMVQKEDVESPEPGVILGKDGEGKGTVFVENELWKILGDAVLNDADAKQMLRKPSEDRSNIGSPSSGRTEGETLLFGSPSSQQDLSTSHPEPSIIKKLWRIYLRSVHPIIHILHAPSTESEIKIVVEAPSSAEPRTHALLFGIYSCATASLDEAECEELFSSSKAEIMSHFTSSTQSALIASSLLCTNDLQILQALMMYLTAIRPTTDPRALWTLTGILSRIAQRLGLHQDGSTLDLSPFETEIRRRIWWDILMLDGVAGEQAGLSSLTRPVSSSNDVGIPANLNDSDLTPDMPCLPPNRVGATEIFFTLARCQIGDWMRNEGRELYKTRGLSTKEATDAADAAIDALERRFQEGFVQYAEPLEPLHLLTTAFARSAVAKMRLMAHYPRSRAKRTKDGEAVTQEGLENDGFKSREVLLRNSLKLIEYHNMAHHFPGIKQFLWHVNVHLQWHAVIYLLSALRESRSDGLQLGGRSVNDRGWQAINQLFHNRPDVVEGKSALTQAVGWLALGAGEKGERENEVQAIPPWVHILRQRKAETEAEIAMEERKGERVEAFVDGQMAVEGQAPVQGTREGGATDTNTQEQSGPFDFAMMDFEVGGLDWDEWEQLMKDDAEAFLDQADAVMQEQNTML